MLFPLALIFLMVLHLVIMVQQKHTEPPVNRQHTSAGKLLGVPFWPHQAVLMAQLFLLLTGGLILLAGFFPVHPIDLYGPPRPGTPEVKPDWYFLWVYGLLKLIPGWMEAHFLGAVINPENIGGVILPGLLILALFLWPFLDRSTTESHYLEMPSPKRLAYGSALLLLFLVLTLAGYADDLGLSKGLLRVGALAGPLGIGLISYLLGRALRRRV